jgi:hypothetical protein
MRLLDLVAQGRSVSVRTDDGHELTHAGQYRQLVQSCPLRYVLSDELACCATQLAFAEGDRLSACLDLIRVPSHSLWVEWAEAPRRNALKAIAALQITTEGPPIRWAGALITAAEGCRSGVIRTFWSTPDDRAWLSPMVTSFDLDRQPQSAVCQPTWHGDAFVTLSGEPAVEELLAHLRFQFDPSWAAYYSQRCATMELRAELLRASLSGCAFDAPMLMALFLLMGARNLLPHEVIRCERINRVRRQGGKPPLLEHIELKAPLDRRPERRLAPGDGPARLSPRLHHVRGHIVRRGRSVFWRSPHVRGCARLGQVRTRTVLLTFGQSTSI